MARTTSGAVQGVLLRDYDFVNTPSLEPFIAAATVIVSRVQTCALSKGITLTSDELELIERWLAAHLYQQTDKTKTSKSTADASASYGGTWGAKLDGTLYGQTAMLLDYSGCLENIAKRQFASAAWLGKPVSDQIPYTDRD